MFVVIISVAAGLIAGVVIGLLRPQIQAGRRTDQRTEWVKVSDSGFFSLKSDAPRHFLEVAPATNVPGDWQEMVAISPDAVAGLKRALPRRVDIAQGVEFRVDWAGLARRGREVVGPAMADLALAVVTGDPFMLVGLLVNVTSALKTKDLDEVVQSRLLNRLQADDYGRLWAAHDLLREIDQCVDEDRVVPISLVLELAAMRSDIRALCYARAEPLIGIAGSLAEARLRARLETAAARLGEDSVQPEMALFSTALLTYERLGLATSQIEAQAGQAASAIAIREASLTTVRSLFSQVEDTLKLLTEEEEEGRNRLRPKSREYRDALKAVLQGMNEDRGFFFWDAPTRFFMREDEGGVQVALPAAPPG